MPGNNGRGLSAEEKRYVEFERALRQFIYDNYTYDGLSTEEDAGYLFERLVGNGYILDADHQPLKPGTSIRDLYRSIMSDKSGVSLDKAFCIYEHGYYRALRLQISGGQMTVRHGDALDANSDMSQAAFQMYGNIRTVFESINSAIKNTESLFSGESPEFTALRDQMARVSASLTNSNPLGINPDGTYSLDTQVDYAGLNNILSSLSGVVSAYKSAGNTGETEKTHRKRIEEVSRLETLMSQVSKAAKDDPGVRQSHNDEYNRIIIQKNTPLEMEDLVIGQLADKVMLRVAYLRSRGEDVPSSSSAKSMTDMQKQYNQIVYDQLSSDNDLLNHAVNNEYSGFKNDFISYLREIGSVGKDLNKVLEMSTSSLAKGFIKSSYYKPVSVFGDPIEALNSVEYPEENDVQGPQAEAEQKAAMKKGLTAALYAHMGLVTKEPDVKEAEPGAGVPEEESGDEYLEKRQKELSDVIKNIGSNNKENYLRTADALFRESVSLYEELNANESFHHSREYTDLKKNVNTLAIRVKQCMLDKNSADKLSSIFEETAELAKDYKKHHEERMKLNPNIRNRLMAANRIILLSERLKECVQDGFSDISVHNLNKDYTAAKALDYEMRSTYKKSLDNVYSRAFGRTKLDTALQDRSEMYDKVLTTKISNRESLYDNALKEIRSGNEAFRKTPDNIALGGKGFVKAYSDARKQVAMDQKLGKVREDLNTARILPGSPKI